MPVTPRFDLLFQSFSTKKSTVYMHISIRFFLAFLLIILAVPSVSAQPNYPVGNNLVLDYTPNQMRLTKREHGQVKAFENAEGKTVMRMITTERPKNIYLLTRPIPLVPLKIPAGRALLVSFQARTVSASLETGEAKLLMQVRQSDSLKDNLKRTISVADKWKTYYLPLETTVSVSKGDLKLALQFGYPPQELLVRDVSLLVYDAGVEVEDLPRTQLSYAGRSVDAPWRAEANRRIERHRKGSFSLQFVDAEGTPFSSTPVSISLKRHHFRWGAAVNAQKLVGDSKRMDRLAQSFNTVVFENDLKIKSWSKPEKRAVTLAAIDSLRARDLWVKGHTLVWPGYRYLPPSVRANKDNPERVTRIMKDHVAGILMATAGKVTHWDVVNEAYSNRDLQTITGSEKILFDGFTTTQQLDAAAGRYVNEFGIISRGGHDDRKQQWYYDYVKRVDRETGGLVQGIGIQSHMGSDLTPPERVYEILEHYADLGKELSISEFTIDLDDPELRFDYTRDFLTIAFSHPDVREFLFWGWYGKTHPKANIFTEDWKYGDMGLAYFQLVHKLWKTEIAASTDVGGRVQGRGFYGTYSYQVEVDGALHTGEFELLPGQPVLKTVKIN